ncbi:MAG: sigma 54-interacting transcriptional regulator [Sedimentibacter sp.]|uniref:sigma-54 interaction domain-containing protein n=1 Tax=Sedimentibacter sp. TaxID=1960295 RepID=UPI00315830B4
MTILMELEKDVNEVAKAVAAVLNVDVEIVDTDLIRVAVVGKLEYMKGKKLFTSGFNYRRSINTGEKYIIDLPGEINLCRGCEWFGNCIYKTAVYAPIKGNNEVVGVISLTAFNEVQADILKSNIDANLYFVDKMANLIYSKVMEKRMLREMMIINDKLNLVMNSIDSGIIATDCEGRVTHINQIGMEKLKLSSKENILGIKLGSIFHSLQYEKLLDSKNETQKYQEVCSLINSKQDKYVVNIGKIFSNNKTEGLVLSFEGYNNAKSSAYTLVNGEKPISADDIISVSESMKQVKNMALRVSQSNSSVMLVGETGTGKEVFSRAIHYHSLRKDKPFVTINCSAIPDSLIESELFGYDKGAFTGANKLGKPGKFEIANGGTIFLDEIEAMPLYMQPKILRVIQEKEVIRVGSNETVPVDVRIISATNIDLEKSIAKGEFRADLYHRLNVIPIIIPPLRERKDDIILLADHFIDKISRAMGRKINGIDKEVEELFLAYGWPGNVRELKNVVEFAINLEDSQQITINNIPSYIKDLNEPYENNEDNEKTLEEIENYVVKKALDKYGWNESGRILAAKKLGISRATIYRKIKNL